MQRVFSEDFSDQISEQTKEKKGPKLTTQGLELESVEFNTPELDGRVKKLRKQLNKINTIIQEAATEWPLEGMNKVDLAILRISVYELLQKETPHLVVIDEAIEIAKEFGAENSAKFVNGVLASVVEKHIQENKEEDGKRSNSKKTTDHIQ